MSSEDSSRKTVSEEFVMNVKRWIEIDDKITDVNKRVKEIKEKVKNLSVEKKEREEYIVTQLKLMGEDIIDIPDGGKLKRNVTKSQGSLNKDILQKALTDLVGDSGKASTMSEYVLNSRPVKERISLRRTRLRKPQNTKN